MGGGSTTTRTTAAPPQPNPPSLLPEAQPGYVAANQYYQDILSQPPVYGGPRVAGVPDTLASGFNAMDTAASGPTLEEAAGRTDLGLSASGANLAADPYASTYNVVDPNLQNFASGVYTDPASNPFFKGATNNILNPIFEKYNTQVAPQIRDQFISAGGEGGSRNVLSQEQGLTDLGRSASDALSGWEAGVYTQEQALAEKAAEATSGLTEGELSRAGGVYTAERALQDTAAQKSGMGSLLDLMRANSLIGSGTQQRSIAQENVTAQQQAFEEPIYRQSAAAQSLMQAPTSAGYPSGGSSTSSTDPGAMGTISSIIQIAALAAAVAAL